jgi:hypothetical protein
MARQTPRRRAWVAIGLATGVVALSVGAWALREWQPFAADATPVSWPANVAPLARYVEDATHLRFTTSPRVEFIADGERFATRVQPADEPSQAARDTSAVDEAVGRALGFWSGEPKLVEGAHLLRSSGDTGVDWLDDEATVVVRAANAKATLSPVDRADLVLILTEILDDQRYDVDRRLAAAPTPQDFQVLAGLTIGQALWVRDQYTAGFSTDDRDSYRQDRTDRGRAYSESVGEVNIAFRALRVAGQTLGTAFVAALHESSDRHAVEEAFTSDVPDAIDQMSMPVHKYHRRDRLEHVGPPPVPSAAEPLYTRQMGPFGVYLVLAGGLDAPAALTAADGWGNDAFAAYRLDGKVCVDARIVADSRTDADRIERGLQAWGRARPKASGALVGRDGTTLLLSVCDPGTKATQPVADASDIDQFLDRADLLKDRVAFTGLPALSECVAVSFFTDHVASDLRGDNPQLDPFNEIDDITKNCQTSV